MASMYTFVLFVCFLCSNVGAKQNYSGKINLGSSLVPKSQPPSWLSPSGRFAFGFYRQGGGFAVGIWLVGEEHNSTVVWTANRDRPLVSANSSLSLTSDGKLVLEVEHGGKELIANTTEAASFASMLDSGNFVLYNEVNDVIWESFRYPTDSLLGGQTLFTGSQLVSSLSDTKKSSGRFRLRMQEDGNLVLYPMETADSPVDAYWSSGTFRMGHDLNLYLNDTAGVLAIANSTGIIEVLADYTLSNDTLSESGNFTSAKNNTIYRATLDVDGVFRLYSHRFDGSGRVNITTKWGRPLDTSEVKGYCGFNSFCTFNGSEPYCQCLPGFDFVDPDQRSLGCKQNYVEAGCKDGKENEFLFRIITTENIEWGYYPYSAEPLSMENCSNSCLEDCYCGGALFDGKNCKKQKLPLRYVTRSSSGNELRTIAFLKMGVSIVDNKTIPEVSSEQSANIVIRNRNVMEILLLTFGLIIVSCVFLIIAGLFMYKFRVLRYERLLQNGNVGLTEELTLRLFSYRELKRATNSFREELGKGSFGAVYKGSLCKGKKVIAVKRLEKLVEEGEREFRAEMQAIGRTHHRNLVRLLGYCAVDSKRLLVYEYMSNGSLADLLFKSKGRPDWSERARIALDVARGILYLHEGCEAPIIHCDIKPQNILMDDFWNAKISDFGLAKLLMPDQTRTFTGVRGTRGYLAPEWHKNVPITVKADTYSYGIVLLEIVCCRRNMEINVSKPEEIVLSNWVYKCFVARELEKLVIGEEVDKKILDRLVKVALWCIQDEPAFRPSMKSVVLMLEGITEIAIPPCPTAASM